MTDMSAPETADGTAPDGLLEKLNCWAQEDDQHWSDWRKKARESFAFVASDQWSREERDQAVEAGRLVTTINRIGPMINAVAGAEIIDRQQVQYVPRSVEDSGVNELLTKGAEWIRDRTMADREESDAFRDTLICGLGYTETIMSYDDEPEGKIIIQRIDPLEVIPDAAARKSNLIDARRMRRKRKIGKDEFKQTYPSATEADSTTPYSAGRSGRPPRTAYNNDSHEADGEVNDDEVMLTEWQWFEYEVTFVTVHPESGQLMDLSPEEHDEGRKLGAITDSTKQRRKVYWRAVQCGGQVLEYERLPDNEFTIKAITGERVHNKGIWAGIVEPMKDPQRFANLFFSMLHHIIRTNAKGGVMAEVDAFVDPKKAQESWARSDAITWMAEGGLQKVKPKDAPQIPPQISQLLQFAVAGIKDASGINEELLGLVGRDQPGVLEHQRKQAAYAILAGYYDSLRFYRQHQGQLLLKYMNRYLPDGYLVRISGEDGLERYMPLTRQPDTIKFDVIVDEAPAGPNQKEKVWGLISNMQALLAEAGPEIWAELIDYAPFPDKVNRALKQKFEMAAKQPPDPAAQAQQQAKTGKDQASAAKDTATARQTDFETQMMAAQGQPIPLPLGG